ncbi:MULTISPECIES: hypothetical protein [Chroococcidiopsis]|nr:MULTISPECIES: hypothetical protein [Chroococcidiopsis]
MKYAIAQPMSLIGLTQAFDSATAINSKKRAIATHPLSVVSEE